MERIFPNNIEAEMGVLGSIIIDPQSYDLVADQLKPDDFYRNAHRVLYQTIVGLAAQRITPDYITLCDELERINKLEEVDGSAYITSLINEVPTSGNVEYYAGIVLRAALNRRLISAAGQIAALGFEQDPESIEKSEQLLFSLQNHSMTQAFTPMPAMVGDYIAELDHLHEHRGTYTGIPTGYKDIDDTLGGLQRSDLILLGGRPSSGKTSLGLCMGYNAALRGHKVAVFSLEMGKRQLMRRMMSMATSVDLQRLRNGWINDEEWSKIIEKSADLSLLPIWINDTAGNPLSSMRSQLRRLAQEQNGIDLVVVDYLGLIAPDDEKVENRVQEVSKISRGLKLLAREFDVPVLALAQLSRAVEQRQNKRPQLADLRDSGSLEQDSDVVLFIYRDAYYAQMEGRELEQGKENIADITVAKHRNGPTGDVQLYFKAEQTMFYDLEHALKGDSND